MADIFLGSGKPKLYLGEQPIGGGADPYAEGLLCDLDGTIIKSTAFLNNYSMSDSATCEICFNIGPNETSAARFITLYNTINTAMALWEFTQGIKSFDLMIGSTWYTDENNTFVIPQGVLTTLSTVFTPSGWTAYLNGTEMLSGSNGSTGTFDNCYIGRNPTSTDRTLRDTTVYSARIYNRALTAAEIAANRAVDVEKFGGG
jgi:hypothetical protein